MGRGSCPYIRFAGRVAVQRQVLLDEYEEKQRILRDLNVARDIQQRLLPKAPPRAEGFDIAGWNKPADETGGDCFDFLALDDGRIAVILADATGHGIGSALIIAECRALFHASISMRADLGTVVAHVDHLLKADLPDDRFVTSFFGLISPAARSLTYLSAGQGPLLKFVAATCAVEALPADVAPLGISPDFACGPPEEWLMRTGDIMALVTDGFFEWANRTQEQYGTARLADVIIANRQATSEEIITRMYEAVRKFAGDTDQADDLTAVVIKKL